MPALVAVTALAIAATVPAGAATPRIRKPGAPIALMATPIGGGAVVAWSAPASDGGTPITGYSAIASHGGQICTTTGATTCTLTGLTDGRLYTVRVRASNAKGSGPPARVQVTPLPIVSLVDGFPYSGGPEDLTLSQPTSSTVSVDFTTSDGPGSTLYWGQWVGAASSFSPSSGTVTFAPGQTTASISFTVNPPNVTGCSLFFPPTACYPSVTVTLSHPKNAGLGPTPYTNLFFV
ncbi:MAG TPA: fibronectin type III domain-containing protein [Acidimicrobiales bacterium]